MNAATTNVTKYGCRGAVILPKGPRLVPTRVWIQTSGGRKFLTWRQLVAVERFTEGLAERQTNSRTVCHTTLRSCSKGRYRWRCPHSILSAWQMRSPANAQRLVCEARARMSTCRGLRAVA